MQKGPPRVHTGFDPRRPVEVLIPHPFTTPVKEGDAGAAGAGEDIEVSFVMPCLNEVRTLPGCIRAAQRCIDENGLRAEIIVADNGSTDGSRELAVQMGARVVPVPRRGYGAALMGGIEAARGRFIIMGDADESYDFGEGMRFVEKLREGHQLVMGTRFPVKGGRREAADGQIMPGAMPWKNRYIGNPVLTRIGRVLFACPASDFHCGLRAFRKDAYQELGVRTTGMEFASEMVVKASLRKQRIAEVPVTLHKDGRDRPPHLRPWRDGWRHLRFMLLLAPLWTLILPGLVLATLGVALGAAVSLGPLKVAGVTLDVHTLVAATLLVIVGYQAMTVGVAARIFALREEIGPPKPRWERAFSFFTVERGIIAGAVATLVGLAIIVYLTGSWAAAGFGDLDPRETLRPMLVGATLTAVGMQTVLMSFFYGMLGIQR